MTARCLWCNRSKGSLKAITVPARNRLGFGSRTLTVYVHPEHEQVCRAACERLYRCVPRLAIVTLEVLLLTAAFLIGLVTKALALSSGLLGLGVLTVLLGVAFCLCPAATLETVLTLGLQASMRLARWGGEIIAVLGMGTVILALVM